MREVAVDELLRLILGSFFAVAALGGLLALPLALAGGQQRKNDCPGKVVCPLTCGEVCRDRGPLAGKKIDSTRADCPGQIECPLTGELVGRDKCPVATVSKEARASNADASGDESELPACCRDNK